jgi:hypothetical protein
VKYLAAFSGSKYQDTTRRIVEDAPTLGVDEVWIYDNWWLKNCRPGFWERTSWFRNHPKVRGIDFFCFKPFYILDAFRRLQPGDILLATDADTFPIADLSPLFDQCRADGGIMLFGARGCVNREWTKKDAFILTGCNEEKYYESWQAVARFALFEKGAAFPVERFLGEWLGFTCNPMINTFDPSVIEPDQPELREPRCEQAVLGLLAVKYNLKLYREACEFGCWSEPEDAECVPPQYRGGVPYQMFSQRGNHTYRPGYSGDESEGSAYRNVND